MSRPWTIEGLAAVRVLAAADCSLGAIADALGRFKAEIDVALWALVGRSPEQAVARLNAGLSPTARTEPAVRRAAGPGLGGFLREQGW